MKSNRLRSIHECVFVFVDQWVDVRICGCACAQMHIEDIFAKVIGERQKEPLQVGKQASKLRREIERGREREGEEREKEIEKRKRVGSRG